MSIYLEFPTIAEYPLYSYPFKNDEEVFFPEKAQMAETKEERNTLQDYLALRMV